MAAHISRDQHLGRNRTVREFIAEFRGLTGTAKQKAVLETVKYQRVLGMDEDVPYVVEAAFGLSPAVSSLGSTGRSASTIRSGHYGATMEVSTAFLPSNAPVGESRSFSCCIIPTIYVIVAAIITLVVLLRSRETAFAPLR
jgi:hypothetical protein